MNFVPGSLWCKGHWNKSFWLLVVHG